MKTVKLKFHNRFGKLDRTISIQFVCCKKSKSSNRTVELG